MVDGDVTPKRCRSRTKDPLHSLCNHASKIKMVLGTLSLEVLAVLNGS